jgi:hypothetical protein
MIKFYKLISSKKFCIGLDILFVFCLLFYLFKTYKFTITKRTSIDKILKIGNRKPKFLE